MDWDALTPEQIASKLEGQEILGLEDKFPDDFFERDARVAAVLIPFMRLDNQWQIVFIRRTQQERDRHTGQVAFPGGRADPVDVSIEATALRETHEETGLPPERVNILGQLGEVRSISNYRVTPVVGAFDGPYPFQPDLIEADRVFTVPLSWLASPKNFRIEERSIPPWGPWPVIYYNHYDGELVWGFTAKLMRALLEILEG